MPGSLNDILPEPISPENEAVLLDLLRRKMAVSLELAVDLLRDDRSGRCWLPPMGACRRRT